MHALIRAATLIAATASCAQAALSPSLGLKESNLDKNGIAMGFLPAWGEPISPNTASSLNALLPQPMAIMGAYAQILDSDPEMTQMNPYLEDLLKQPGELPVFALALMPSQGLANVTQAVAERIADRMAEINAMGVTVWLRYAHEMNGEWYAWGQQPAAFIASWNMVSAAVRAKAPDTYMLWSPNERFSNDGSVDNVHGGYTPYWPGAENVDIVGLSFYHYGGFERLNNFPAPGDAMAVMTEFDQLFGSTQGRPFILSETGAAFTRDADTHIPAVGNATEGEIKWDWLWQITGPEIRQALPFYRALCWFEVVKDENAAGDSIVKEEDFRIITGNGTVALGSRNYFAAASNITNYVAPPVNLPGGSNATVQDDPSGLGVAHNESANINSNSGTSSGSGASAASSAGRLMDASTALGAVTLAMALAWTVVA